MRKEVWLAVLIGFGLGLALSFGFLWLNQNRAKLAGLKEIPKTEEPTTVFPSSTSPSPSAPSSLFLTLDQPEDESLINQPKTTVSGTTLSFAQIAITYEEGEALIEADEKGNFQNEISLIGGANDITVTAFSGEGEEISKSLTVVYSTAQI